MIFILRMERNWTYLSVLLNRPLETAPFIPTASACHPRDLVYKPTFHAETHTYRIGKKIDFKLRFGI